MKRRSFILVLVILAAAIAASSAVAQRTPGFHSNRHSVQVHCAHHSLSHVARRAFRGQV